MCIRDRACVLVAVMACVLAVVGLGLIATGRLCITSARRPADRYGQDCCSDGGGAAGIALSGAVDSPDVDFDGIPDDEDILAAALSYIGTRPHYKSAYCEMCIRDSPDIERVPAGINAVVAGEDPGIIFVLRNVNQQLDAAVQNPVHPFYLVYVKDDGEVLHGYLSPKDTLDAMRRLCPVSYTHLSDTR